jgi:hypothetical protein
VYTGKAGGAIVMERAISANDADGMSKSNDNNRIFRNFMNICMAAPPWARLIRATLPKNSSYVSSWAAGFAQV